MSETANPPAPSGLPDLSLESLVRTADGRYADVFDFDAVEPQQKPVRYQGKKYVLLEASESAHAAYQNVVTAAARFGEDGQIQRAQGLADADPVLLAQCLYAADRDGRLPLDREGNADRRHLVPIHVIKGWPHRVTEPMVDWVCEVSGLRVRPTEQALEKQIAALTRQLEKLRARRREAEQRNGDGAEPESEQEEQAKN